MDKRLNRPVGQGGKDNNEKDYANQTKPEREVHKGTNGHEFPAGVHHNHHFLLSCIASYQETVVGSVFFIKTCFLPGLQNPDGFTDRFAFRIGGNLLGMNGHNFISRAENHTEIPGGVISFRRVIIPFRIDEPGGGPCGLVSFPPRHNPAVIRNPVHRLETAFLHGPGTHPVDRQKGHGYDNENRDRGQKNKPVA